MKKMKLAFIGDSYCTDILPGIPDRERSAEFVSTELKNRYKFSPYPSLVAQKYKAEITAQGLGGRHLFHSYEILLKVVDEADYTVFCVSEPFRLPNRYKADIKQQAGTNLKSFHETEDPGGPRLMKKIQTAIDGYYNHLISVEWHQISQKGLLMVMDELMLRKKKKCIWFPCFDESVQGFIPKSGPYSPMILSDAYAPFHEPSTPTSEGFLNHFNETGNRLIANLIIDIIDRDAFDAHAIKMEDYFEME